LHEALLPIKTSPPSTDQYGEPFIIGTHVVRTAQILNPFIIVSSFCHQ